MSLEGTPYQAGDPNRRKVFIEEIIRGDAYLLTKQMRDSLSESYSNASKYDLADADTEKELLIRGFVIAGLMNSVRRVMKPDSIVLKAEFVSRSEVPGKHQINFYGILVNDEDNSEIRMGPFKVFGELGLKGRAHNLLLIPSSQDAIETVQNIAEVAADGVQRILNPLGYTLQGIEKPPAVIDRNIYLSFRFVQAQEAREPLSGRRRPS